MFLINDIVKDGILEIRFNNLDEQNRTYSIFNATDTLVLHGEINGFTQRTCLYIGDLKKGKYTISFSETDSKKFEIK